MPKPGISASLGLRQAFSKGSHGKGEAVESEKFLKVNETGGLYLLISSTFGRKKTSSGFWSHNSSADDFAKKENHFLLKHEIFFFFPSFSLDGNVTVKGLEIERPLY